MLTFVLYLAGNALAAPPDKSNASLKIVVLDRFVKLDTLQIAPAGAWIQAKGAPSGRAWAPT